MEEKILKIEQYEGPLDLLLALIQKHKIDILDIPISDICEQYIEYIETLQSQQMEVTGEFIVMGATLMLIKSRMLLPREEGEEDPRQPLVDALLEHRRAELAAVLLKDRAEEYYNRFTREPEELPPGSYSRLHPVSLLVEAFIRMGNRIPDESEKGQPPLFEKLEKERYFTVDEKVLHIAKRMSRLKRCAFTVLFDDCGGRGEIIATFLALLEMVRDGAVMVNREENDEIYLEIMPEEEE